MSLIAFNSNTDPSSDLTIFITSYNSSIETINVVIPDPFFSFYFAFFLIAPSVADIAIYNPNGNKTFLAAAVSILFH